MITKCITLLELENVKQNTRYKRLSETPLPPVGVMSVKKAAKALGVQRERLDEFITENGIQTPEYRFGSTIAPGISPEDFTYASENMVSFNREKAGFKSITTFASELGVSPQLLRKHIDEHQSEIGQLKVIDDLEDKAENDKGRGRAPILLVGTEQQDYIKQHLKNVGGVGTRQRRYEWV
jgi:hypothetical protein